jgi:hypothetical protein
MDTQGKEKINGNKSLDSRAEDDDSLSVLQFSDNESKESSVLEIEG